MSNPEETLDIQTPENVAFGYQVAGIGSRFLASLLDTTIIVALLGVVILTLILILNAVDTSILGGELTSWVLAIFGLILFIFYWGYYIFFEMLWNGQTPGKRWVGLRVLRTDGTPITISESFIRNLARFVDFLPAAYGIGVITMFLDKQSRRLGDIAAGTLVVHDRAPISIQTLSARRSVIAVQGRRLVPLDGFPLERLTNDDLNMIEDFFQRRNQLMHRESLAKQILNALHTRVGLPLPAISQTEAEDMLLTILYTVQKRESDEYWRTRDSHRSTGQ